jgi:5S rRNA maturation endonuclease (ribonuclease M5)
MEQGLKFYIEKYGSIKSKAVNEKLLWNPLDKAKINRFNFSYQKLLMNDNDERIKDDFFIKLNKELLKYKDQKSFEIYDDDMEVHKLNKDYDKKLKTHIEEYFSNSQHNSVNNSLHNKNNKSIDVNSLDMSNLNISRNQNNNSQVFQGDLSKVFF